MSGIILNTEQISQIAYNLGGDLFSNLNYLAIFEGSLSKVEVTPRKFVTTILLVMIKINSHLKKEKLGYEHVMETAYNNRRFLPPTINTEFANEVHSILDSFVDTNNGFCIHDPENCDYDSENCET